MLAIKAATRILLDIPTDEGKLLAHYLGIVDAFVRRMPRDEKSRAQALWVFRDQLTLECDERFEALRLEFISEKLDKMVGESVTGRGKLRVVGVAAHLAVNVGAWGFNKLACDSKANLDAAREKLSQAQKKARKSKQTAPTFGKHWTIKEWEDFAKEQFDRLERAKSEGEQKGSEEYRSHRRYVEAKKQHAIAIEQLDKLRNKRRRK